MASTQSAPRRSKESDKIGSFQRQEEIGRGSFATVYKAIHTSQSGEQTTVAIKSVNLSKLNKKLKDNLTSEISILKGLHHPHIVALIDCKDTSSHIHLVMEFVALGDLSYFIKRRDMLKNSEYIGNMIEKYPNPKAGGLHEVVVRHFLQQLASALQFLRARNLIHRDVKPQNLLLSPSPDYFKTYRPQVMPYCTSEDALIPLVGIRSLPMLKIADFGFARSLPSTSLAETLCGSPLYMAPEILRYEKYDAKADLWSVGTVLYEALTSRPPFRAANHVELLRRIEKCEDRIKFGDDIVVSRELKTLIRGLLKRDPKERLSYADFFSNDIITGPIPGLAAEDMPAPTQMERRTSSDPRRLSRTDPLPAEPARPDKIRPLESPYTDAQAHTAGPAPIRRQSITHRRLSSLTQEAGILSSDRSSPRNTNSSPPGGRPGLISHATAPARQEIAQHAATPTSTAMARQRSVEKSPKTPSLLREHVQQDQQDQRDFLIRAKEATDKQRAAQAAQDIAFERDYVLVEKRTVEVNALADELEASPRFSRASRNSPSPHSGAMVRRATTQGAPTSTTGAQTSASRAVQIASGRRPDTLHQRQSSYERRYGVSTSSATSAISKALNMASGRLFGVGFSPPVNLRPGNRSPPVNYGAVPSSPGAQSSLIVVGESQPAQADQDSQLAKAMEELATRADVVYGFAEVKYKQIAPLAPSATGFGLHPSTTESSADTTDNSLTLEATVVVSEEALVLYEKALSLIAKGMYSAHDWWEVKGKTSTGTLNENRIRSVVYFLRGRFNEAVEKMDFVQCKLAESQRRLPEDHRYHVNRSSITTGSSAGMGLSTNEAVLTTNTTAEKIMYERAIEMCRTGAIDEITGEDLPSCELSYVTAMRMFEVCLEWYDASAEDKGNSSSVPALRPLGGDDNDPIKGLETVTNKDVRTLIIGVQDRLVRLRRKLQARQQQRATAQAIGSPNRSSPPIQHRSNNPTITATPPK